MFTRTKLNMDIVNVWLLFGTMHVVSRVLTAQASGEEIWDMEWAQQVLFLLLGFTTYYIIVKQFLPITSPNKVIRAVISDVLMFGTAFLVVRVLSGGSLTDQSWIKSNIRPGAALEPRRPRGVGVSPQFCFGPHPARGTDEPGANLVF